MGWPVFNTMPPCFYLSTISEPIPLAPRVAMRYLVKNCSGRKIAKLPKSKSPNCKIAIVTKIKFGAIKKKPKKLAQE